MPKFDHLVQGVEGEMCLGEFNEDKGCDNVCGRFRVRPSSGEALKLAFFLPKLLCFLWLHSQSK